MYCKLLVIIFLGSISGISHAESNGNDFSFVALGDTAYTESTYSSYENLIQIINKAEPKFTIHVGDTIGYQECSDETYLQVEMFFNSYDHPVIYTPGDNEWTDCWDEEIIKDGWNPKAMSEYKLSRLEKVRKRFFPDSYSLGQNRLPLTKQSEKQRFSHMVENALWAYSDVLFATIHIVGSANGLFPHMELNAKESIARANAAFHWIDRIKNEVSKRDSKALVIAFHAQVFDRGWAPKSDDNFTGDKIRGGVHGPYYWLVNELSILAEEFGKPILIVHGDYHNFRIDKPFLVKGEENEPNKLKHENVTRLQVYGAPELKAVRIRVEPDTPWVFSFSPLHN